jgi:nucleoside 2-deoxyribosyltransferase
MKIYFAGAIYGGRKKLATYQRIQKIIENLGHIFLTKHVTSIGISTEEKKFGRTPQYSYKRDIKLLDQADCLIAEVTLPSLGVGYELCYAIEKRKIPTLALYEKKKEAGISALVRGICVGHFQIKAYTKKNLEKIIKNFIKGFEKKMMN